MLRDLLRLSLRSLLIFAVIYVTFIAISVKAEDWQTPAYVEYAFNEIALQNEYDTEDYPVRKWATPIKAWIDHQVGNEKMHRELIDIQFTDLTRYTGHPFEIVDSPEQANMVILFSDQQRWQQQTVNLIGDHQEQLPFDSAVCLGHLWITTAGEIVKAVISIPVDKALQRGKLVTCVVEELTQAMGLPNDSDTLYPSIFNDRSVQSLLTPLDVTLLRLLYSNELKAGASAKEAIQSVKQWLVSHPNWLNESIGLSNQSRFKSLLSDVEERLPF